MRLLVLLLSVAFLSCTATDKPKRKARNHSTPVKHETDLSSLSPILRKHL